MNICKPFRTRGCLEWRTLTPHPQFNQAGLVDANPKVFIEIPWCPLEGLGMQC